MLPKPSSKQLFFSGLLVITMVAGGIVIGFSDTGCSCIDFHSQGYEKGWPGSVYYYPNRGTDEDAIVVKDADYWSFQIVDKIYAFDRNHLYKFGKRISPKRNGDFAKQ